LGLLTWLRTVLSDGKITETEITSEEFFNLQAELYIRNLAFQSAVNLVARAISKCEFKTFLKGKEVKQREYYLWNVEPNKNQNSSEFIQKWISKLYKENECLIVELNGQLLIADSFNKKKYALYDWQFSQVTVEDYTFNRTFSMSEVLYFQLNNEDIRRLINGMYETYGKLISYAQKTYQKSRGRKGILDVAAAAQGKKDFQETFSKLMNERFKTYFEADNAVLPLFDGYTFNEKDSKTYSNDSSRDIRAMVDDIYDFTARAFCIPPALLRGDVANINDAVVDILLTFGIDPVVDMLHEEINRKRSGYEGFTQGTFIKIDTKTVKHIDLLSVATSIDKLISSGAFCINDIRVAVGDQPIDEPWAKQHFMTKNYSTVEDLLKMLNEEGVSSG
jgi:HK97 family phage portal protein